MVSSHEEAEGSRSTEKGGMGPQIQRGGCLGPWWLPRSPFPLCDGRLHIVPEIFLTFQRLQTGNPPTKPGLQMDFIGLTQHLKNFDPIY